MNESNKKRKRSANQEIERLHFLVRYRLCWHQLGCQITARSLVGANYPHRCNSYRNDSISPQALERLELSQ